MAPMDEYGPPRASWIKRSPESTPLRSYGKNAVTNISKKRRSTHAPRRVTRKATSQSDKAAPQTAEAAEPKDAKDAAKDGKDASKETKKDSKGTMPSADHLATYFRDLSEHDLLDPEQEQEIARGIEDQERMTWERLLAHPSVVDYVLRRLEVRLENSLKGFRDVRKAAEKARRARTKSSREKLREAAEKVSHELRSMDLDRTHVEAVIGELEGLRDGRYQPKDKLPFVPTSKAFVDYLRHAHEAYRGASLLRNEFVRANLRLVVTMARRYDRGGMPLSDLIQEGNLGLMHAVSRFDYRRGLRFSTYACWWIRHAIGRALADKARAVRIPVHMLEAQQQLAKVEQQLTGELGRTPTPEELAKAAKVPMSKLNQMHRYLMGAPMSLDKPLRDDDDRSFGDILADPELEDSNPEDELTRQALTDRVQELMDELSPIEADVLKQRFGLDDDEERTFREIGDQYQLSRERIRQIQNAALGKLRRALQRHDMI
jgi:RNA polymerase primary sigma factor